MRSVSGMISIRCVDDCFGLDFDEHQGVDQPGYFNHRGRRRRFGERGAMVVADSLVLADVSEVDACSHHVGQRRAEFLQR